MECSKIKYACIPAVLCLRTVWNFDYHLSDGTINMCSLSFTLISSHWPSKGIENIVIYPIHVLVIQLTVKGGGVLLEWLLAQTWGCMSAFVSSRL